MKKVDRNPVTERIIMLRRQYAGERGKSKFAHDLGISPSTYSYYENDRVPPADVLVRICELTGADLAWLLTGREMEEKSPFRPWSGGGNYANAEIMGKLDALLRKNPTLSGPISAFIELLAEKAGIEKKLDIKTADSDSAAKKAGAEVRGGAGDADSDAAGDRAGDSNHPGWIPILGRTAAGIVHRWDEMFLSDSGQAVTKLEYLVREHIGRDIIDSADGALTVDLQAKPLLDGVRGAQVNLVQVGGQQEHEVVEFVQCEEIYEMFPDSFALRVDGDSMSPRINDGDIVILSPSVPAAQGCAAVAHIADQIGVTCKLIRTTPVAVHLIPINEKYETKVVGKNDLVWALAVLCHIQAQ